MPENLMNSAHKSNSDAYREGWERTFNLRNKAEEAGRAWGQAVSRAIDDEVFKILTQDMNNA